MHCATKFAVFINRLRISKSSSFCSQVTSTNRLHTMMEDNKLIGKRLFPTHIYDYNYKVSEGYYKPQKKYMDSSMMERGGAPPPKHSTYAERFAAEPWYGQAHGLPYKSDKSALNEPIIKLSERPYRTSSLVREIRNNEIDDVPLNVRINRRKNRFEEEDEKLGIRPRNFARNHLINGKPNSSLRKQIQEKLRNLDDDLSRFAPRGTSVTDEPYTSHRVRTSHHKSSDVPLSSRYDDLLDMSSYKPKLKLDDGLSESIKIHREFDYDTDNFPKSYTNKTEKHRHDRRFQQSRDITDGINNIVEKMRLTNINYEDGYTDRRDRGLRASTMDPSLKDEMEKGHVTLSYKRRLNKI